MKSLVSSRKILFGLLSATCMSLLFSAAAYADFTVTSATLGGCAEVDMCRADDFDRQSATIVIDSTDGAPITEVQLAINQGTVEQKGQFRFAQGKFNEMRGDYGNEHVRLLPSNSSFSVVGNRTTVTFTWTFRPYFGTVQPDQNYVSYFVSDGGVTEGWTDISGPMYSVVEDISAYAEVQGVNIALDEVVVDGVTAQSIEFTIQLGEQSSSLDYFQTNVLGASLRWHSKNGFSEGTLAGNAYVNLLTASSSYVTNPDDRSVRLTYVFSLAENTPFSLDNVVTYFLKEVGNGFMSEEERSEETFDVVAIPSPPVDFDPTLTIVGNLTELVTQGDMYVDAGATAYDLEDGDITALIVATSTVDTSIVGGYTVTYLVTDSAGHSATAVRTVTVIPAATPPSPTPPPPPAPEPEPEPDPSPPPPPPAPVDPATTPTNLTAYLDSDVVILVWDAPTNFAPLEYVAEVSEDSSNWTEFARPSGVNYVLYAPILSGQTLYFRVAGVLGTIPTPEPPLVYELTPYSEVMSVTREAIDITPQNLTATPGPGAVNMTLDWDDSLYLGYVFMYNIRYCTLSTGVEANCQVETLFDGYQTNAFITGLERDTEYIFHVSAMDLFGQEFTASVTGRTTHM